MEAPILITTMVPFDNNNFHLQPFFRFSSLLNFARIFFVSKTIVLPVEDREEQTSLFRQDLGDCLLVLLDLGVCLHS